MEQVRQTDTFENYTEKFGHFIRIVQQETKEWDQAIGWAKLVILFIFSKVYRIEYKLRHVRKYEFWNQQSYNCESVTVLENF